MENNALSSFPSIVQWRGREQPERLAYELVAGDELVGSRLTYGALATEVERVGAALARRGVDGQTVAIVLPPGLALITAFLGAIGRGCTTTLLEPPTGIAKSDFLAQVLDDFGPALVLTGRHSAGAAPLAGHRVAFIETLEEESRHDAAPETGSAPGARSRITIAGDAPCLIQYTSGSSGPPKGVVLTHDHLIANSMAIQHAFRHTSKSRGVIWLPPYHDMGLIGGILQPLYAGFPVTLLSPRTFLQKPARLLRLISHKRATTSGGANFGYDLCVRKIDDDALVGLDLSSWDIAFCGAEPVLGRTLTAFSERFSPVGFRSRAFLPCYGLAEATLLVTSAIKSEGATVLRMDLRALAAGQYAPAAKDDDGMDVVGCGYPYHGATVKIVCPDTRKPRRPNTIGEIWVASPCNARGFWGDRHAADDFAAETAVPDGNRYLRTGDLGFLHRNQLFVTGRIKDQLNINGRKYNPEVIERTAADCLSELPGVLVAAVPNRSVDHAEGLAIVVELPGRRARTLDPTTVFERVACRAAETTNLVVERVLLVPPGSIRRTRNGKLQRWATARALHAGEIEVKAQWVPARPRVDNTPVAPASPDRTATRARLPLAASSLPVLASAPAYEQFLLRWLAERISQEVKMPVDEILVDPHLHFGLYGLDSLGAQAVAADLGSLLGGPLGDALLWDYPNLAAVARHLAAVAMERRAATVEA